ncbi:uncharacterized protein LOC141615173 [Silene latifolia]|uniref:uncharacterized protein LOC141615173 n=1 Tax=Silene latifolia TaxID=37657 RepID=UPI003D786477
MEIDTAVDASRALKEDFAAARAAGEVAEDEILEEEVAEEEEAPIRANVGRGGRQLRGAPAWAETWDSRHLLWAAEGHLSYRTVKSLEAGNIRSLSGYTTAMECYERLSAEERAMIEQGSFGALVQAWRDIAKRKLRANLSLVRAFLDRLWDTTSTFHMPFGEVGVTLEDYGMISGLPCGTEVVEWPETAIRVDSAEARRFIGWNLAPKAVTVPGLVPSSYVRDYFTGNTPTLMVIDGR